MLNSRAALLAIWIGGGANLLITLGFWLSRWSVHPSRVEQVVAACYVITLVALAAAAALRTRWRRGILLGMLGALASAAALGIAELALGAFPAALPDRILIHDSHLLTKARGLRPVDTQHMLEYLAGSPRVKFRANVLARSFGYRGQDFVSEWMTDALGFKNHPAIAALQDVTAVAIGDSFVEAMGVSVDDQWTTLVSRAGFPVYSLGVQGYAPQDAVGALRRYGPRFRTQFVLFGFTPGFEERSLYAARPPAATAVGRVGGPVESIHRYLEEVRRREYWLFPVTNAIISAARVEVQALGGGGLSRTRAMVERAGRLPFDATSPEWTLTLEALKEATRLADRMGAELVVVLFAREPYILYEQVTGTPSPDTHYETRLATSLREFCLRHDIALVDLHQAFFDFVRTAKRASLFFYDGHPNQRAQPLIAADILRFFEARQVPRRPRVPELVQAAGPTGLKASVRP